jgi:chaperonin GroEL
MKLYKFGNEGRKRVLKGINIATDCVSPTLGAIGKKAIIGNGHLDPLIVDDGAKILNMIDLNDQWENIGNRMMRKIVNKMHHKAGSGRTTAAVLARAFANEVNKELKRGKDSREVSERLEKGLQETLSLLSSYKQQVLDGDIKNLALTESLDEEVADIISKAILELGRDGVITVETSNQVELTLDTVKGMRIRQGLITENLINDKEKGRCILNNPYVLITDRRVASNSHIKGILDAMLKEGRTELLIVALDVEGEALASLIMNHQRELMNIACIQAPYGGQQQKDFLKDLAILTNGTVVSEEAGLFLDKATLNLLGEANSIIVDKEETIISGGKANEESLNERISIIKGIINITAEGDKKIAEERLAGLTSGVGVIRVGAFTIDELRLKVNKIEDAINSTRLALDEGIIAGGGSDLVRVAYRHSDPLFRKALIAPFKTMEGNAGMKRKWWQLSSISKILYSDVANAGINFKSKELVNMMDVGIIDAYKVERIALETAISVASNFCDIEVTTAEFPEKQD